MRRASGPAPIPAEVHRRRGTKPNNGALKPLDETTQLPAADEFEQPEHAPLGKGGQWLLDFVLEHVPWIAPSDLPVVLRLAQLEDERAHLYYRTTKYGNHKDRRALRAIDEKQLLIFASLGMSPADRTRQRLGEVVTATHAAKLQEHLFDKSESREKRLVIVTEEDSEKYAEMIALSPPRIEQPREGDEDSD